jgi:ATP synthase protein I
VTLTTTRQRSKLILKIFLSQTLSAAVIAGGFLAVRDGLAGTSFLIGALCASIPHSLFTWYVFRFRGDLQPDLVLKSIYRGETLKFLLLALLVAAVLKHLVVVYWIFFSGLVFAFILQAVLPILINYDNWD